MISHREARHDVGDTETLEPEEVIDVGIQVAGLVKEFGDGADGLPIEYGSPVVQGTILARIDDYLYAAKTEQTLALLRSAEQRVGQAKVEEAVANPNKSKADLLQSKARANQSERDWKRTIPLKSTGSISDTDYDMIQGNFEVNNADVVVSDAAMAQALTAEGMSFSNQRESHIASATTIAKKARPDRT